MLYLSDGAAGAELAVEQRQRTAVVIWLLVCCAMIFAMVVLGGVTRLTGSGLSMVDWRPIMGAIPPLNHEQWMAVFEQYKNFPEFKYVNHDMDLAGFKFIFLFEYGHRLLGRLIGIVFFVPMMFFWWRKALPRVAKPHLIALFILGGCQGLLGWYMVKSGLVDNPHVSQYRLTAHLGLAVLIYGYMLFIAAELGRNDLLAFLRRQGSSGRFAGFLMSLVFLMILLGGLVAGTRAGFIYNTFPDMNGAFIPPGIGALTPAWLNFFENPVAIQFNHRVLGWLLLGLAIYYWLRERNRLETRVPGFSGWLLLTLVAQFLLGVATLLYQVPVALGAIHQAGAMVVFSVAVVNYQRCRHQGDHD